MVLLRLPSEPVRPTAAARAAIAPASSPPARHATVAAAPHATLTTRAADTAAATQRPTVATVAAAPTAHRPH